MSQQVTGVIDSIYTKSVPIKNGPRAGSDGTVYHAMIDGLDINLGFKCDYVEGEHVTLNVNNGRFGWEIVKGNSGGGYNKPAQPPKAAAPRANPKPATEFPVPKNTKGITIARQNSGGHAATLVSALIASGNITDTEEAINVFMDYAYQITDFATGQREADMAASMDAHEK
jgi:hypothetical protein